MLFTAVVFTDEVYNSQNLIVGDKSSLYAGRFLIILREKQHVSFTEQFLSPAHVEDRPGIHLGRDSEGDPAGHVGLDDARDDVYRRTLGRNDQMDARSSCKLGQADDGSLHLTFGNHHEICELIDNDDQSGQNFKPGISPFLNRFCHEGVKACQIADIRGREQVISLFHFRYCPVQCRGGFAGICDDRYHQMRDLFVNTQFDHLGVDQQQADLVRGCPVENAEYDRVDTDGFTGSCRACDQYMGHAGNVGDDRPPAQVLTNGKGQSPIISAEVLGLQKVPQVDGGLCFVGDLDSNRGFTRDRGLDPDVCRREAELYVIGQVDDLADFDSLVRPELIAGDSGALADICDCDLYAEGAQGFLQAVGGFFELPLSLVISAALSFIQQGEGRRDIVVSLAHGSLLPGSGTLVPCIVLAMDGDFPELLFCGNTETGRPGGFCRGSYSCRRRIPAAFFSGEPSAVRVAGCRTDPAGAAVQAVGCRMDPAGAVAVRVAGCRTDPVRTVTVRAVGCRTDTAGPAAVRIIHCRQDFRSFRSLSG